MIEDAKVAIHRVIVLIHGDPLAMEKGGSLPRIGETDDSRGTGGSRKEGTTEESLEVEGQVGLPVAQGSEPGKGTHPTGRAPEFLAGEEYYSRNSRVPIEQSPPRRVKKPTDFGIGVMPAERRNNR